MTCCSNDEGADGEGDGDGGGGVGCVGCVGGDGDGAAQILAIVASTSHNGLHSQQVEHVEQILP